MPDGPSGKRVKGGEDLVYIQQGMTGYVYLLKGYRNEFYRFNTATEEWEALPAVGAALLNSMARLVAVVGNSSAEMIRPRLAPPSMKSNP
mgnify:CR=1 FL=1